MKAIMVLLFVAAQWAYAQPAQNNWYIGGIHGINFSNGRQVLPSNPNTTFENFEGVPACMSDPVSGDFLFQANGSIILDRNFNLMPGAGAGLHGFQTNIATDPYDSNKHYVVYSRVTSIYIAIVDMSLRNGMGDVILVDKLLRKNALEYFTIVRTSGLFYNLITHSLNSDEYMVYALYDENAPGGISSNTGPKINAYASSHDFGNMISNKSGTMIALTCPMASPDIGLNHIQLLNFDKCSYELELKTQLFTDLTNLGGAATAVIAFSPTDKYLFASVMGIDGSNSFQEIIRYNLADPDPNATRLSVAQFQTPGLRTGSIALAPDGKMYVISWGMNDNKPYVSIIHNPEESNISFEHQAFRLPGMNPPTDINFVAFPNFMMDTSYFIFFNVDVTYGCFGDSVYFHSDGQLNLIESVLWDFGDGQSSNEFSGSHMFTNKGDYKVLFRAWYCGGSSGWVKFIRIQEKPVSNLRADTVLCAGAGIELTAELGIDEYLWSTGETSYSIEVKNPGKYWVKSRNGTCSTLDSINIDYHPPIWVELGDEFYLCEDDSQVVTLDAGKGFNEYLWTPTGETSQWIKVRRSGPYYVIVEDFNGCSGEDGTVVERRCNMDFEIPNAFTPNGDGMNDFFGPVSSEIVTYNINIYNRWGEEIFSSSDISIGWDGKWKDVAVQEGVYFYMLSYSGYTNYQLQRQHRSGVIHLLR